VPGLDRLANGTRFTLALPAAHQLMRDLHPPCHVGVGRAAWRRVVLEAAVLRRCARRDDDAVGEVLLVGAVVNEDRREITGVASHRCWTG